MEAIKSGKIEKVKDILKNNPGAINQKEEKDRFFGAAHLACLNKDLEMLKFLRSLDSCDFEMLDIDEETPLFVAV